VARLRRAGASGELTLRMDSGFWSGKLIKRLRRHRVRYSITVRQTKTVRAAIAVIPEAAWVQIAYAPDGVAEVAETGYRGDRLIVRRVRNEGDQQQLFATWRYHGFVTDRVGTTTWLDADHRRHAVCELAIRDLKAGAGLAHLPTGRFAANAAWLLAATLAHNLLRWTASLGLGARDQQTVAKTLRRTLLTCPGGSPARRGDGRCTCPPNGPGRSRSGWRWRGCAASRTRPDQTSITIAVAGWRAASPSYPAHPASVTDPQPRRRLRSRAPSPLAAPSPSLHAITPPAGSPPPDRSPTCKPNRWIQAETTGQGCVLRPLCASDLREQPRSKETTDQRSRRSSTVSWVWLDLNQRPHPETKIARVATGSAAPRAELGRAHPILIPRGGPRPWGSYQQNAGNRCANRRSRRSHST